MTAMEKVIVDFELQLRDIVGKVMKRSTLNSATVNYGVQYLTNDESGFILIVSTNNDALNISFHKGKHPLTATDLFSTQDINNFNKAEQALETLRLIIAESAYEGLWIPIEEYVDRFKKSYTS